MTLGAERVEITVASAWTCACSESEKHKGDGNELRRLADESDESAKAAAPRAARTTNCLKNIVNELCLV